MAERKDGDETAKNGQEKDKGDQKAKPWVRILIALIGMVSAIVVAHVTSRAATESAVKEVKEMRPIHLESGELELNPSIAANAHFDMPFPSKDVAKNYTPRVFRKHVDFVRSFEFDTPPHVHTGISALDCGKEANLRIASYARNLNEKGFDLEVRTWSDSRVYSVTVHWIAYRQ
jgi:hypothetical protein